MAVQNKSKSSLGYEGKVTVKLYHGKKVYKTVKVKNSGTVELFKFVANCLTGNYYSQQRPLYLRAFNVTIDGNNDITDCTEVTTTAIPVKRATPLVHTAENYASVLNEFLIPASTISNQQINMFRLYSTENKNNTDKPSAEVILSDDEAVSKDGGTSNIKVDWTLLIGNAEIINEGE